MFEKEYKRAMDKIKAPESVISDALKAAGDDGSEALPAVKKRSIRRIAFAAGLAAALIAVSVIGIFAAASRTEAPTVNKDDPSNVSRESAGESSEAGSAGSRDESFDHSPADRSDDPLDQSNETTEFSEDERSRQAESSPSEAPVTSDDEPVKPYEKTPEQIDAILNDGRQYYTVRSTQIYSSGGSPSPDGMPTDDVRNSDFTFNTSTYGRKDGLEYGEASKFDGRYIYMISDVFYANRNHSEVLYIFDTKNGSAEPLSVTEVDLNMTAPLRDADNRFVIRQCYISVLNDTLAVCCSYSWRIDGSGEYSVTCCVIYDISDRKTPRETARHTQSGYMVSAPFINGGAVYMITAFRDAQKAFEELKPYYDKEKLGLLPDSPLCNGEPVEIVISADKGNERYESNYTVIGAVKLDNREAVSSAAAIRELPVLNQRSFFSFGNDLYFIDSISMPATEENDHVPGVPGSMYKTDIYHFTLGGGEIGFTGKTTFDGQLEDVALEPVSGSYVFLFRDDNRTAEEYDSGESDGTGRKTSFRLLFTDRRLVPEFTYTLVCKAEYDNCSESVIGAEYFENAAYIYTRRYLPKKETGADIPAARSELLLYTVDLGDKSNVTAECRTLEGVQAPNVRTYNGEYVYSVDGTFINDGADLWGVTLSLFRKTEGAALEKSGSYSFLTPGVFGERAYIRLCDKALLALPEKGLIIAPLCSSEKCEVVFFRIDGGKVRVADTATIADGTVYDNSTYNNVITYNCGDYVYLAYQTGIAVFRLDDLRTANVKTLYDRKTNNGKPTVPEAAFKKSNPEAFLFESYEDFVECVTNDEDYLYDPHHYWLPYAIDDLKSIPIPEVNENEYKLIRISVERGSISFGYATKDFVAPKRGDPEYQSFYADDRDKGGLLIGMFDDITFSFILTSKYEDYKEIHMKSGDCLVTDEYIYSESSTRLIKNIDGRAMQVILFNRSAADPDAPNVYARYPDLESVLELCKYKMLDVNE